MSKNRSKTNTKLGIQRVGPFRIEERVGINSYRLETGDERGQIPPDWKIHPVISVQQLEPVKYTEDEYQRPPAFG
jgi:hypothetical protein